MRGLLLGSILVAATGATMAGDFDVRSGPDRVSLLELYTSEGCSSCPPADQWLSGLRGDPRLWREVVPVAFHVDYWDRLGWADRFADASYTARQSEHARALGMRSIYTPGLFVDGAEWRSWFGMRELQLDPTDTAGELHAWREGAHLQVRYRPQGSPGETLQVHVALLGFGLASEVQSGENAGRELRHDFVVLGHGEGLLATVDGGALGASLPLPQTGEQCERLGLAVWVSREHQPAPLQAVGGWLTAAP